MDEQPSPVPEPRFLDPHDMIERSYPVSRAGWFWYLTACFFLLVMLSTFAGSHSPDMQAVVRFLGGLTMIGLMIGMSIFTWIIAGRQREEQRSLDAIEELVQLRRWPEAGMMLQNLLSKPTRSAMARIQGLIYLTTALARYHRFGDAIVVQEHLLETIELDPGTGYALRLGRAMAMLQEDHLTDADRAISELRRVEGSQESAGLALIQIYRDVKTGHPAEAIELFTAKELILRKQMGHRVADAWALVAKAYDMVGREELARQAYRNATLLAPIAEISRKYSEVASLTGKYPVAEAPGE
jgi:tetratricopeptide (TPR) repeat protein